MAYPIVGMRGYLGGTSGADILTAASVTVTDDLTAGDDVIAGDNVSGASVTAPLIGTVTAADVVFQRNSATKLTLTSTGAAVTGDLSATTVTCPLIGTTSAVDAVFQRNSATKLTLTSTGAAVTGDASATTVTCPLIGTTTAADVVFQRNSTETLRISSTGVAVPVGKFFEVYNVGDPANANYERASHRWISNAYTIQAEKGGTGTNRQVHILHADGSGMKTTGSGVLSIEGSSSGVCSVRAMNDTVGIQVYGKVTSQTTYPNVDFVDGASGSIMTASSGTQTLVRAYAHSVNQSGTAGFNNLVSDTVINSNGSGSYRGLSIQRGGTEVFGVDVKAVLSADADTVMFLTYYSSSTVKNARVTLDATDSGGTGYRALRVPN